MGGLAAARKYPGKSGAGKAEMFGQRALGTLRVAMTPTFMAYLVGRLVETFNGRYLASR
jgi:hypothetical protein